MIKLPDEEYTTVVRDGKIYHVCTLRQMVLHTIGLDYKRPYIRHGKKFYRPYRNYFTTNDKDRLFQPLVEAGYMVEESCPSSYCRDGGYLYYLTRAGLDWLGEQIGVTIYNER